MEVIAEKVKKFGICPVIDMGLTTKYEWWMDLFNKPGTIRICNEDQIEHETIDNDKDNKDTISTTCNNSNTSTYNIDSNDYAVDKKDNKPYHNEEMNMKTIELSIPTKIQKNNIQATTKNDDHDEDNRKFDDSDSKNNEVDVVGTFRANDQTKSHSEDANEKHKQLAGMIDNCNLLRMLVVENFDRV